ncbi:LysR substrate-binding domain-containing protein [Paenibacillus sp. 1001270B_150601_E10]|uniref:LysR substrate-binding domain-containing protein n=1 Tax=Paenibacillus sp. 1001270B_150601_E10 TaxID=2787079 RepID=UPI001E3D280E|nr:LysR substrate-binding domain-containing protein [Paenibacillus sp. 1001270B_150601_E10]
MLDFELLKMFITVAEQRHFSRAADILHLTQPTVSMRIRQLEEQIGVTLFERSPKRVELTPAGHIMLKHARDSVQSMEQALQDVERLSKEVTGELTIGASFTIGEYLLPYWIATFSELFPNVQIRVSIKNTNDIVQDVYDHLLDGGFVEGRVRRKDMQIKRFAEDDLVLVAGTTHPLAIYSTVQLEQLGRETWIVREPGSGTRSYSDQFMEQHDLEITKLFEFGSNQGVKEAVRAGLGLAILSKHVVSRELESGELRALHVIGEKFVRPLTIVERKGNVPSLAWEQLLHVAQSSVNPHKT